MGFTVASGVAFGFRVGVSDAALDTGEGCEEGGVTVVAVTVAMLLGAVLAVLPFGVVGPVFFLFLGIVPLRVQKIERQCYNNRDEVGNCDKRMR